MFDYYEKKLKLSLIYLKKFKLEIVLLTVKCYFK